jgi:hypothetical protein
MRRIGDLTGHNSDEIPKLPRLYADRAFGRDRHYRAVDRDCGTGARQRPRAGPAGDLHVNDNNGVLPATGGDGNASPLGYWSATNYWANAIPAALGQPTYNQLQLQDIAGQAGVLPGAGSKSIFICASAGQLGPRCTSDLPPIGNFLQMWGKEPSGGQSKRKVYWCYVTNSKIDNTNPYPNVNTMPGVSTVPFMVEKIMNPNEYTPDFRGNPWDGDSLARGKTTYTCMAGRHFHKAGLAFVDAHVEDFGIQQLWPPTGGTNTAGKSLNYYRIPGLVVWDPYNTNN